MRFQLGLVLLAVTVFAAGCGSESDQLRSAVSAINSTIHAYNSRNSSSLQKVGTACSQALSRLNAQAGPISKPPSSRQKRAALALRRALQLAQAGFADCLRAARIDSYPSMVRANTELANANRWIRRAAQLDH